MRSVMARSIASRLPIKVTMPLLLTLPVVTVAVALSLVAFVQGRSTANHLANQSMGQIHSRIEDHLSRLLDMPPAIAALTKRMLASGELSLADMDRNRLPVAGTLTIFQAVSSVVIGRATGEVMWVIRYPGESTYEYAIKRSPEAKMEEYPLGDGGRIAGERLSEFDFHTTERPWYKAAIAADGPTWGDVYIWVRNGRGETLGIPYVEPYRDPTGRILGVINCELTLSDISAFLGRLEVGRTGRAFIIESGGTLVATSVGLDCMKDGLERLPAVEAPDPWIAQSSRELLRRFGSPLVVEAPRRAAINVAGERMRAVVSPYHNRRDLHWLIVTLVPEADFLAEVEAGQRRSIAIALAAVALTVLLGVVLAVAAVRPILALVAHARRIGEGDLEHELHLDHTPELAQLSAEINAMTAGLRDRMRLRHSLALAMEVQQTLLPSDTPMIEGLDIAGHSIYCDETGGDYYDFLDIGGLSRTTAAIAVGDVMGHGVAAAMFMATARGILLSRCQEAGSLADLLTHVNRLLVGDGEGERFMTMLLMTIDGKRREMRWATAGHDTPFVYDPRADRWVDFDGGGVPLGIMADETYEEYTFAEVRTGQVYLASTDGVWEACNEGGEVFGKDRLRELIRRNAHRTAAEIGEQLRAELTRFRGDRRRDDDETFVVVKVL
jgi:sigma-B regulation protein RsbU (phosphoserine phosphatase)